MASALNGLEADFFGDLVNDTHGVWEVFEFVRLHYPELTDEQVFERGYDYIAQWLQTGLVRISDMPLHSSTVTTLSDLLHFLGEHGVAATRYLENAPSLDITQQGRRLYEGHTI
jgi:hypothetical protein